MCPEVGFGIKVLKTCVLLPERLSVRNMKPYSLQIQLPHRISGQLHV
jgi:hypothetical protein